MGIKQAVHTDGGVPTAPRAREGLAWWWLPLLLPRVFLEVYEMQKPLLSHTSISHEGRSGYSIHHGQDDEQRNRLPTCGLWLVWGQMEGEGGHPWFRRVWRPPYFTA